MNWGLRLKFSVMMLLQYAIWGAWAPPLFTYMTNTPDLGGLGLTGSQAGWVFASMPLGAIFSPFLIGIVADRYFSTQRSLGILHLLGGGFLFLAGKSEPNAFWFLFGMMVLHALCYMPTLALTNSICFRNMTSPEDQFPGVRVFGTLGWIVVGLGIGFGLNEVSSQPLLLASGLAGVLGIFCFFLPHTPPTCTTKSGWVGAKALGMLKDRSFSTFLGVSFLISILLAFYYLMANPFLHDIGAQKPQALMTIGQGAELLLLPFLPFFIARLGVRWTLTLGMVAWLARYGIFATENLRWVIFLGLPLHGICYDFFFVTSQIYVDRQAPPEIRASAQGLLAQVTLGLGMFLGNLMGGSLWDKFTTGEGGTAWGQLWIVPCLGALVSVVLFLLLFRPRQANLEGKP